MSLWKIQRIFRLHKISPTWLCPLWWSFLKRPGSGNHQRDPSGTAADTRLCCLHKCPQCFTNSWTCRCTLVAYIAHCYLLGWDVHLPWQLAAEYIYIYIHIVLWSDSGWSHGWLSTSPAAGERAICYALHFLDWLSNSNATSPSNAIKKEYLQGVRGKSSSRAGHWLAAGSQYF